MRSIDRRFYEAPEWRRCKAEYLKSVNHLCERCLEQGRYVPAKIVHHIIFLNSENFGDPELMFGYDNLLAVCQKCHNDIHGNARNEKRWKFVDGELVTKETEEWKSGETL